MDDLESRMNHAVRRIMGDYDPHFADRDERIEMDTKLFLLRLRIQTITEYSSGQDSRIDPIPMILFCPSCGVQHVDAPKPHKDDCRLLTHPFLNECTCAAWVNPPHTSHLCAYCGHVWRPADVPTAGVKDIATRGRKDNQPIRRIVRPKTLEERLNQLMLHEGGYSINNNAALISFRARHIGYWWRSTKHSPTEFHGPFPNAQLAEADAREKLGLL